MSGGFPADAVIHTDTRIIMEKESLETTWHTNIFRVDFVIVNPEKAKQDVVYMSGYATRDAREIGMSCKKDILGQFGIFVQLVSKPILLYYSVYNNS